MSMASGDEYLVADSAVLRTSTAVPAAVVDKAPPAQWPYLIVSLFAVGGLGLIVLGSLREGLLGLALSMGLAATVRLLFPATTSGWLVTRSRAVDAGLFALLGAALGAVALFLFS